MQYSIQLASAHSSPVSTKVPFLPWFFFFFEIFPFPLISKCWHFPSCIFPVSLDTRMYLLALLLSGHQATADSSTSLKRVLFLSRRTQRAWGRHPNGCDSWEFRACPGWHSYWPLASQRSSGSSFPFLCLYNFLPRVEDQGPWNGAWHFPGRWDPWTQMAVSQIWSSSWYSF